MLQPSDSWKQFSAEELEKQYSPSMWQLRMNPDDAVLQHVKFSTEASSRVKEIISCHLDIPYGPSERARVDIFGADILPRDSPILFYVHGGYWQELSREIVSCFVDTFVNAGVVVAVVGYDLAPNECCSDFIQVKLDEIVDQVKSALIFVLSIAEKQQSRGLFMCGWSAGAQLIAMSAGLLSGKIVSHEISNYIKGFIFISGIFDLRPLEHTTINNALLLAEKDLIRNSPIYHIDKLIENYKHVQCLVAVGQHDPPEFRRQSQQYHEFLLRYGISSKHMVTDNEDHFLIIENLCDSQMPLTQEMIKMMTANGK